MGHLQGCGRFDWLIAPADYDAGVPLTKGAPEIICEENVLELSDYTGKDLQVHR
jgi:hypothetical protein